MRLFGFGGGKNEESPEAKQRREASILNLQQGGLPLNAIDRLREQAGRQNTPQHLFTSDLSVNELAVIHQAGYEPLGQVMGSSIYHVGWQWTPNYNYGWSGSSGELQVLTQAYYEARHLAIGRLLQEATLLGATGIVGVRLERKEYEWGSSLLEFAAIGTAIREADIPPMPPGSVAPFVSDLSGEEFWMLRQAGYRPVGFVVGNCSYYCIPNWNTRNVTQGGIFGGGWQNQELPDYTQGVYNARSLAMQRMEHEARVVHAEGVVGADIEVDAEPIEVDLGNDQKRLDILYHFTAIGTAIAPYQGRWPVFSVLNTVSLK
ncbi:MAG TPA: heavy metal-binding domain-containing protein [Chthonomonadaceae bacterium]|nr:heavy metal-binding domain-containing protein [Chthonomonadaceae bacterium]